MSNEMQVLADNARSAETLLKALANSNRLMILCALFEGELSVGELNEKVPISQSALSQHLATLREKGLVDTRRVSQTIYYHLCNSGARKMIEVLHEIYCGPGAVAGKATS